METGVEKEYGVRQGVEKVVMQSLNFDCRMLLTRNATLPLKRKTNENNWLGCSVSRACMEVLLALLVGDKD